MKDRLEQEIRIGDLVKTRSAGNGEYFIGKIKEIGKEYIYLNYFSRSPHDTGGWLSVSLTKIPEDEAIILILKGNS